MNGVVFDNNLLLSVAGRATRHSQWPGCLSRAILCPDPANPKRIGLERARRLICACFSSRGPAAHNVVYTIPGILYRVFKKPQFSMFLLGHVECVQGVAQGAVGVPRGVVGVAQGVVGVALERCDVIDSRMHCAQRGSILKASGTVPPSPPTASCSTSWTLNDGNP